VGPEEPEDPEEPPWSEVTPWPEEPEALTPIPLEVLSDALPVS